MSLVARYACTTQKCPLRMSCARAHDKDYAQGEKAFGGKKGDTNCSAFVLRRGLGRDNPDLVFTESRRRGKRHNAHAYTSPRKSYPGAEALFGSAIPLSGTKKRRRGTLGLSGVQRRQDSTAQSAELAEQQVPKTKRPDLMVTRHIRDGRDINNPDEQGE